MEKIPKNLDRRIETWQEKIKHTYEFCEKLDKVECISFRIMNVSVELLSYLFMVHQFI